jgi:hypothetical protein
MKQCSWCQSFDGQAYWKVVGGILGGKDGKTSICRLKDFHALIGTEGGNECDVEVSFCSRAEAIQWEKSLGKRFIKWIDTKAR